jgi:hypothetical protein
MNISEKYKTFLWLQPKAGSVHAVQIFRKFEFTDYYNVNGEIIYPKLTANHHFIYPWNHKSYIFLCTTRNPFTRILSFYKFNCKNPEMWNPNNFEEYFFQIFKPALLSNFMFPFKNRTPDIFIRQENLLEDYSKIDFIKNSEFYQSGEIEKLCQQKFNHTDTISNPQEYFTQDMIDYIYDKGKKYFELSNYSYPF